MVNKWFDFSDIFETPMVWVEIAPMVYDLYYDSIHGLVKAELCFRYTDILVKNGKKFSWHSSAAAIMQFFKGRNGNSGKIVIYGQ